MLRVLTHEPVMSASAGRRSTVLRPRLWRSGEERAVPPLGVVRLVLPCQDARHAWLDRARARLDDDGLRGPAATGCAQHIQAGAHRSAPRVRLTDGLRGRPAQLLRDVRRPLARRRGGAPPRARRERPSCTLRRHRLPGLHHRSGSDPPRDVPRGAVRAGRPPAISAHALPHGGRLPGAHERVLRVRWHRAVRRARLGSGRRVRGAGVRAGCALRELPHDPAERADRVPARALPGHGASCPEEARGPLTRPGDRGAANHAAARALATERSRAIVATTSSTYSP